MTALRALLLVAPFALPRARRPRHGAVRTRLARLADAPPTPEGLREEIRRSMRDPTAEVRYRLDDGRWVDAEGRPAPEPAADAEGRAVTPVALAERPIGALLHSAAVDSVTARSTAAAVAVGVERDRVQIALRARIEELRDSRSRVVAAGLEQRRRIERTLHAGAQQRLLAMSLTLRLAQAKLPDDAEAAGDLIAGAQAELGLALEELRELARILHPAAVEHGLEAALNALADRTPIPVVLDVQDGPPLPEPVAQAAYLVAQRGVAEATKHTGCTFVTVRVERPDGTVAVEVRDDGAGSAENAERERDALSDVLAAFDGRVSQDASTVGTRLRAEIPVPSQR